MTKEKLNNSISLETYSFYYKQKPSFISDNISWPCFGLKTSKNGEIISNTIPAKERFKSDRKTVSTTLSSRKEKKRSDKIKNTKPKMKNINDFG